MDQLLTITTMVVDRKAIVGQVVKAHRIHRVFQLAFPIVLVIAKIVDRLVKVHQYHKVNQRVYHKAQMETHQVAVHLHKVVPEVLAIRQANKEMEIPVIMLSMMDKIVMMQIAVQIPKW